MVDLRTSSTSWPGLAAIAVVSTVIFGCATLSPEEREAKRAELDEMGEITVSRLLETRADIQDVLDRSIGYVVVDMSLTKIPMIGAGKGLGVVIDKRTGTRSYIKVSRFDVGGGIGAQKFKTVIVFDDGELLDRVVSGAWHYEAGAEAGVGSETTEGTARATTRGYQAFKLVDSGAVATVTVRVAYAKPYLD